MIYYLACKHRSLGVQLKYFPGELARNVRLLTYDDLYARPALPAGTYVFADFDRLPPDRFAKLCKLWDWFDRTGAKIRRLNDPRRALCRFDLLRRLHEAGINNFNVYRIEDWREVRQFPVFIRKEKHQKTPLTNLLHDRSALEKAIDNLGDLAEGADLMIVEFCKGLAADGRYRKYGAFRVGEAYYIQHCYISKDWYIKSGVAELGDAELAEAARYRSENPHVEQIAKVFDIAGIDYGRMDYRVVDDRIQIFEINTHPTVISLSSIHKPNPKIESPRFALIHEEAMLALDGYDGTEVKLPPELFERGGEALSIEEAHARALSESVTVVKKTGALAKLAKLVARLRA
jgi:hypothetical protein